MCDIYGEYCKLCGEATGFHLGDFNTDRFEISYICSKHTGKNLRGWLKRTGISYCIWSEGENKKYIVLALTENAWKNRHSNHQNMAYTDILEEVPNSKQTITEDKE